jgi:V/A-type H+-transporting ATPase subunit A
VGAWAAGQGDTGWAARRARAVSLLAEADRLGQLAELVGEAALPGHERMIMLAGRLLREGVLRQSALSPNDAYCPPSKAAALIEAMLKILVQCEELVAKGVLATTIETADFTPILRAAEETAPDDAPGVLARRDAVLKELEALS